MYFQLDDDHTFKEHLTDWTDVDVAQYRLARSIHLMTHFQPAKHVFWTNHPVGAALYQMLEELVTAGVLEKRDEPDLQFRWNPNFKGSWENANVQS